MLLSKTRNLHITVWNYFLRNMSGKTLVLKKKSRKKSQGRLSLEAAVKKKISKKKVKTITKTPSDYCEEIWLNNLNVKNLKLYRKTSFGSFRKINVNNLLDKLSITNDSNRKIVGDKFDKSLVGDRTTNCTSLIGEKAQNAEWELASPHMSDYLVENMLAFPLLRTNCSELLASAIKDEKDDYGLVDSVKFPSVTRILNETMSESAKARLEEWKKQMTLKLGEEGFQKYSQDMVNTGAKLHRCLKTYLVADAKDEVKIDDDVKGCWNSLERILPDIRDVKMVEEGVHHPVLMYKGVVDCVATYQGLPCVIEWKKSERVKKELASTHDAPLQLCAYLGALSWLKSPSQAVATGLVVVAYPCGSPANVFKMDPDCCQYYWLQWLRRLQSFWVNKSSVLQTNETE